MRSAKRQAGVVLGVLLLSGACASSTEWQEWTSHSAHFASAQHMGFSLRNTKGAPPRATRDDVNVARSEQWWGQAITVAAEQIIER
ncbi:MAG: hypothetical protein ACREM3_12160 [Candidatus Rokuibacteriota bacterium]